MSAPPLYAAVSVTRDGETSWYVARLFDRAVAGFTETRTLDDGATIRTPITRAWDAFDMAQEFADGLADGFVPDEPLVWIEQRQRLSA